MEGGQCDASILVAGRPGQLAVAWAASRVIGWLFGDCQSPGEPVDIHKLYSQDALHARLVFITLVVLIRWWRHSEGYRERHLQLAGHSAALHRCLCSSVGAKPPCCKLHRFRGPRLRLVLAATATCWHRLLGCGAAEAKPAGGTVGRLKAGQQQCPQLKVEAGEPVSLPEAPGCERSKEAVQLSSADCLIMQVVPSWPPALSRLPCTHLTLRYWPSPRSTMRWRWSHSAGRSCCVARPCPGRNCPRPTCTHHCCWSKLFCFSWKGTQWLRPTCT